MHVTTYVIGVWECWITHGLESVPASSVIGLPVMGPTASMPLGISRLYPWGQEPFSVHVRIDSFPHEAVVEQQRIFFDPSDIEHTGHQNGCASMERLCPA